MARDASSIHAQIHINYRRQYKVTVSRLPDFGSKMGIDANRKWPTEGFTRPWPEEIRMDEKTKARVTKRWKEFGLG